MSKLWKITKSIFWVMIVIASIFVIFSSLNLFGYQMYVVKSGSMEPNIKTGSVVINRKSSDYLKNNVITYKLKDSKDTITHRVVEVKTENNTTSYVTKGDANRSADPDAVLSNNVVGKVLFSIPLLGYLIAFIKTLPGLLIFVIVPSVIIVSDEIATIKSEAKNASLKRKEAKRFKKQTNDLEDLDIPADLVEIPKDKNRFKPKRELIQ